MHHNSATINDCGFVYVATGEGYVREALVAISSLRQHHPSSKVCLVTDKQPKDSSLFDDVIVVDPENVLFSPVDKLLATLCPYKKAIFLDTDTFVVDNLEELFRILDCFEIALLPETKRGWDYDMPDVPTPFAEFNTGVIVFRNDERIKMFFDRWRDAYMELKESQGLINDQASFRRVLFNSDIRVAPLPSEYHFLGNTENYIMWKAKIIHARGNLSVIESQVNKYLGCRVYIPDVGKLQGFQGKSVWFKRLINFFFRGIRLLFVKPTDSAGMNPGKWWLKEKRS
ncbi:hypothetical protein NIES80_38190 [Dolichospermum planctonicum]|uniref:Nucleotide-diphospho-sugar transferase domain-containing protein n=1 Tax=Dolichospermum planctonicum TaxID=136072 RepID=A0A480AG04_9CYAN|nr:hypothetical protein NIES80_38190 [Dolichospermum planctonicum]